MQYFIKENQVYAYPSSQYDGSTLYDLDAPEVRAILNPELTLEEQRAKALDGLADYRFNTSRSGIVHNGVDIQSDVASVARMHPYVTESMINGLYDIEWKKADGSFHNYTVQELKPVYKSVVNYIGDCFKRERVLHDEIMASSDPWSVDITTGWPSNVYD